MLSVGRSCKSRQDSNYGGIYVSRGLHLLEVASRIVQVVILVWAANNRASGHIYVGVSAAVVGAVTLSTLNMLRLNSNGWHRCRPMMWLLWIFVTETNHVGYF